MPDTIPDIRAPKGAYINLNETLDIPLGKTIIIQNKKLGAVHVQVHTEQPHIDSHDGFLLSGEQCCIIRGESSPVWVNSHDGNWISVQVVEE